MGEAVVKVRMLVLSQPSSNARIRLSTVDVRWMNTMFVVAIVVEKSADLLSR